MSSGFSAKSLAMVLGAVLALYFAGFYGLEYLRHRKGPWEVSFSVSNAVPVIDIAQKSLHLERVRLVFTGESTNVAPQTVRFDAPLKQGPFGTVIYEDLTFLPGVVTFDLFGHEVELLPRVLIVNKREIPWQAGQAIVLRPAEKLAQPPHKPKARAR